MLEEPLRLHDLQDPARPDHVDQAAAPGGVDPALDDEDVLLDLVHAAAGHDPADLRLLGERDDVGGDAELLVRPRGAGRADAGLHLVEDHQRVVIVGELLHPREELGPDVVVAALALDRLGDERGDVVRVRGERALGLLQRAGLGGLDLVAGGRRAGSGSPGTSMRGQSNFGNRSVLFGSVLVSDSV